MDMTWAGRIKDLEALGWSLASIAERIGSSPQSVSDIKNGRSKAPNGDAAVELYKLHRSRRAPPAVLPIRPTERAA